MTTFVPARAEINGGPSKFDLTLALFDRKPIVRAVEFKFTGESAMSALVVINEIGIEDGSGESWLFKGYVRSVRIGSGGNHSVPPLPPRRVHGWYRTDTRKGWIETID